MKREQHRRTNTPEYRVWCDIHTRCYNTARPEYARYGGRGIKVCSRWRRSFSAFFADMGPRPSAVHSIDRIDNSGDYAPGNCRWATAVEQANNKRNTVLITIDGVTKPLRVWARERGVNPTSVWLRLSQGHVGNELFQTTCQKLTHNGTTATISEWSLRTGLKASTISMRVNKYGWPVSVALTKGVRL